MNPRTLPLSSSGFGRLYWPIEVAHWSKLGFTIKATFESQSCSTESVGAKTIICYSEKECEVIQSKYVVWASPLKLEISAYTPFSLCASHPSNGSTDSRTQDV